jgi:hypothetical protein
VNCHLVTIKVSVESSTYQGVDLDGTPINEYRLKGLEAKPVEGRGTVKQYRLLFDDLLEYVIYLRPCSFHQSSGTLNIVGKTLLYQSMDNKWLK